MTDNFGRDRFKGLDDVREIIADPNDLYRQLGRVRVEMPLDLQQPRAWGELADEVVTHESVLTIVNSRKDARELYRLMPEGAIHLSALMCGQHRPKTIAEIKVRLQAGLPTRVVSTHLVEGGVDLHVPVLQLALGRPHARAPPDTHAAPPHPQAQLERPDASAACDEPGLTV